MTRAATDSWSRSFLRNTTLRLCSAVLADEATSVLLHAPPGYGKSRLRDHLIAEYGAIPLSENHPDFNPSLLWQLLVTVGNADKIVGASRVRTYQAGTAEYSATDLALREADLPPDAPSHTTTELDRTNGWPDYFALSARPAGQRAAETPEVTQRRHALIEQCLADADSESLAAIGAIAHFDRFTPEMLTAVDRRCTVESLLQQGLPIVDGGDGWLMLLEPVRSHLRTEHDFDADLLEHMRRPLLAAFGPLAASEAILQTGHSHHASALLRSVSWSQLEAEDSGRVVSLLNVLLENADEPAELHLLLANAHLDQARFEDQRVHLLAAKEHAHASGNDARLLEAEAELLLLDKPGLSLEDASKRFEVLRSSKSTVSRTTRTRINEIEALLIADSAELADIHDAVRRLQLIANEWELLGERSRAAQTLRRLCAGCLNHLGEFAKGIALLERASKLVRDNPQALQRTNRLTMWFSARIGDNEAFSARRDLDIQLLGPAEPLPWEEAYRSWAEMIHAALNSSASRVRQAHDEALARLGELHNGPTGSFFLSDAAICAALAGDEVFARKSLEQVRNRSDVKPIELLLAEFTVASCFGSPEDLEQLHELRVNTSVPAARSWLLDLALLRNAIRHDAEPPVSAESIMNDARRFGLELLAQQLLDLAGLRQETPQTRVEVLGPLVVIVEGERVEPPPGKVTELLKLLAVRDTQLPVEIVVDHLWPETDVDRGRARLRNCLNRLRNVLGPETLVRSGDTIALARHVAVDLREFWGLVADAGTRKDATREAVALFKGDLLEADVYADWLYVERLAVQNAMKRAIEAGLSNDLIAVEQASELRRRMSRLD